MGPDIPEEKLNQEVAKITALARPSSPPSVDFPLSYMSGGYLGPHFFGFYTEFVP